MKIILVYNADEGLFNAVTDTIHKVLSPSTYSCSLCRYTYGVMGMLRQWSKFLSKLPYEKKFYHRKDFAKAYPEVSVGLPAIFVEIDGDLDIVLTAEEINECESLERLIQETRNRLATQSAQA